MDQIPTERRVTMQDIARETGYSVNTVSHALRDKRDIASETKEYIRSVARDMGYMRNQIASSLRSGRTRTIAVIMSDMSNPFYGLMADTLQDAALERGYSLIFMCSRDRAELELKQAETAIARRVDGVLLFPSGQSGGTILRMREMKMPFVLVSRQLMPDTADSVVSDDERGAYLATRHLIEAGCRKLAFLSMNNIVYSCGLRRRGFDRACDEAGIPAADRRGFIAETDSGERSTAREWRDAALDRLRQWKREGVTGLFIFCDMEAWSVLSIIQSSGDLSDSDFSIAAFDDIQGSQQYPAPLCSVNCSFGAMAETAVDLLRDRIHGDSRPPQTLICPVRLVCRGSCHAER